MPRPTHATASPWTSSKATLFQPDDPLAPPAPFEEPWQAQALALADTLVKSGPLTPAAWAEALGTALREAEATGAPDTLATYYDAVLTALERVTEPAVTPADRATRRAAWEAAYRRTPHGKPVTLPRS